MAYSRARSRSPGNNGVGESDMHRRLVAAGYPFERQHPVERWRVDLALWPLALELERDLLMPHALSADGQPFDEGKYNRLLGLLDRGWYVMTMCPPWIYEKGWVEAVALVTDHLARVEAGTAPRYVSLKQYQHHGHWLRSEGTYVDGALTVVALNPPPPVRRDPNPGPPRFKNSM